MERASILVVDDEPAFLRMLTTAVRLLGYEPISAPTAEAALEVLSEKQPSLIVTDVRLPGMDGIALARAIKSSIATPVLLMSAYGRPPAHEGDGFIGKPFQLDELSAAIGECIQAADAPPN